MAGMEVVIKNKGAQVKATLYDIQRGLKTFKKWPTIKVEAPAGAVLLFTFLSPSVNGTMKYDVKGRLSVLL